MSWLDSIVILAAFPPEPRIHFLGDPSGLIKHRVQWSLVRATGGYVPVDPKLHGDPRLFEQVNRCLQKGGVVALYPEGNYEVAEAQLLPFKKGFAHFAIDNQVPVLPVALSGTRDLWLRKKVRVIIGEPIDWQGQTVEGLVEIAERRMRELVPAYKDPGGIKLFRKKLTHLF
jgi:1-acyl-sn-glycerol-3-phosphate acyltransferase